MKLEDQVLSIKQVQELRELGFDVKKHSSIEVNITITNKQYIVSSSFFKLYPEFGDDDVIVRYSTMSIGDIIDVLPTFIEIGSSRITHKLGINNSNIQYFNNNNIFIRFENNTQIYRLFQCLKWCIKQKHIAL